MNNTNGNGTKINNDISNFSKYNWLIITIPILFAIILGGLVWFIRHRKNMKIKAKQQENKIIIPVVKPLKKFYIKPVYRSINININNISKSVDEDNSNININDDDANNNNNEHEERRQEEEYYKKIQKLKSAVNDDYNDLTPNSSSTRNIPNKDKLKDKNNISSKNAFTATATATATATVNKTKQFLRSKLKTDLKIDKFEDETDRRSFSFENYQHTEQSNDKNNKFQLQQLNIEKLKRITTEEDIELDEAFNNVNLDKEPEIKVNKIFKRKNSPNKNNNTNNKDSKENINNNLNPITQSGIFINDVFQNENEENKENESKKYLDKPENKSTSSPNNSKYFHGKYLKNVLENMSLSVEKLKINREIVSRYKITENSERNDELSVENKEWNNLEDIG